MTQTITRERKQKFIAILEAFSDKLSRAEIEATAELLADASISRAERAHPAKEFDIAGYFNNNKREYFDIIKKHIPGASFNKILAARDEIIINIGDTMKSMFAESLAHDIDPQVFKMSEKLAKLLGFVVMPLTPSAVKVYQWVIEQERNGQKVESFATWAKNEDNLKYIKQYRNNPENIMTNWPQAFPQAAARQTDYV